jgi:hypothetical protein
MIIRQAELCRQLVTDIAEHWVRLQEPFVDARSPVMPACIALPTHVSLMGIPAMRPIDLNAFGRLAEYIEPRLQNRGTAECRMSFCAQTTVRFMCSSDIVARPAWGLYSRLLRCFVPKCMDSQPPGHPWWPTRRNRVWPNR